MLTKISEECFVEESMEGLLRYSLESFLGWQWRKEKIDGTDYGSPFKLKKEVMIYTKGEATLKTDQFLYQHRTKTYWDKSLVLTPSLLGLTQNQIIAYKNFLFENKKFVDEPVLIVRQKRSQDLFCKIILPGKPLPAIKFQGKCPVAWNVYEPIIQKTYDVDFRNQLRLVSDMQSGSFGMDFKTVLARRLPNGFYRELKEWLTAK
jgi:hypothetical protein